MTTRRTIAVLTGGFLAVTAALPLAGALADQPPTAPPAVNTYTTTAVTDATWSAELNGTTASAVVECAHPAWTATITGASWIWAQDAAPGCDNNNLPPNTPNETVTFTKNLDVTGAVVTAAQMQLAVDNSATVYVNGQQVQGGSVPYGPPYPFTFVTSIDLTNYLTTGSNTISIVAVNGPDSGGPGGVLASVSVTSSTTLTDKDMCKNGGWQQWTDPVFKNQGDCVSYVVSHSPQSS